MLYEFLKKNLNEEIINLSSDYLMDNFGLEFYYYNNDKYSCGIDYYPNNDIFNIRISDSKLIVDQKNLNFSELSRIFFVYFTDNVQLSLF